MKRTLLCSLFECLFECMYSGKDRLYRIGVFRDFFRGKTPSGPLQSNESLSMIRAT